MSEAALSDRLADLGARLGGGTDYDRGSLTLRTLSSSSERDAAVALMREVLARPTFPEAIVEREKARTIAGLKEAETRPDGVAGRRFANAVYGSHPYGNVATAESVARISRDDLVAFHRARFVVAQAVVTMVGDIGRAEAERLAEALTVDLPRGEPVPATPSPSLPAQEVIRVANPSAQAHILIGMPVFSRDDPDYFPLLVGNYVLGGGGFVSRLTHEVREKRGLAYSAYSYLLPAKVAGPFQIGLQTKGSQADQALKVVDETLQRFLKDGPTAKEMEAARSNLVNGFGLRLDSNRKILDYVAIIGFYGLPLDWLDAYPKAVAKVTPEQARDAFRRRISPEHLVTVVVGGDGDGTAPVAGGGK